MKITATVTPTGWCKYIVLILDRLGWVTMNVDINIDGDISSFRSAAALTKKESGRG